MKKINLILILLFSSILTFSQGNLSIKTVEYGTWMEKDSIANVDRKGYWQMDEVPVKYIALIEVTKNIITHTNKTDEYIYFIKDTYVDKEKERVELKIVDEFGNRYMLILDNKNSNIRFIYRDELENLKLTKMNFTNTWVDI